MEPYRERGGLGSLSELNEFNIEARLDTKIVTSGVLRHVEAIHFEHVHQFPVWCGGRGGDG